MAVRLAWIGLIPARPLDDCRWYYDRGVDLVEGAGYVENGRPTAYWPVGYPAFLGLLFYLVGPSLLAAKVANVVLQMGILLCAYGLAKRLFESDVTARITVLILALYPAHIAYTSLLVSEVLFLFLFLLGMLCLVTAGGRPVIAAMGGIVLGLACLVRPVAFFVPLLFFAVSATGRIRAGMFRRHIRQGLLVHAAMMVTIAPWAMRNYTVFERFAFISTNGGINLLIGNSPYATGTYIFTQEMDSLLDGARNECERDVKARDTAVAYMLEHPRRTVRLWRRKVWFLYRYDENPMVANRKAIAAGSGGQVLTFLHTFRTVGQGYYVAIGMAFVTSLIVGPVAWRRGWAGPKRSSLGLWIVLYFTAIHMVFWGNDRFHFPMMPWIVMYAAALAETFLFTRGRQARRGVRESS